MVARLFAYVGTLAAIAMLGLHFRDHLPELMGRQDAPPPGWSVADRSHPAFDLSALDPSEKSVTYTILRHPEGGRKDVFSWMGLGDRPLAELEIYRLGREARSALAGPTDLALRMPLGDRADLEAGGVIDSKFGTVALLRRAEAKDNGKDNSACMGFFKDIEDPPVRLSGWTCHGGQIAARRHAIACMLDRLTLLTAGNEPKLAELFARAELGRQNCNASFASGNWITEAANPQLRGPL